MHYTIRIPYCISASMWKRATIHLISIGGLLKIELEIIIHSHNLHITTPKKHCSIDFKISICVPPEIYHMQATGYKIFVRIVVRRPHTFIHRQNDVHYEMYNTLMLVFSFAFCRCSMHKHKPIHVPCTAPCESLLLIVRLFHY